MADKGSKFNLDAALARVQTISHTTKTVLELAQNEQLPTGAAADRLAKRRLQPERSHL